MPNYKEMYLTLFRSQTRAIEILQKAQQETEELYISSPEPSLTALRPEDDGGQDKPE